MVLEIIGEATDMFGHRVADDGLVIGIHHAIAVDILVFHKTRLDERTGPARCWALRLSAGKLPLGNWIKSSTWYNPSLMKPRNIATGIPGLAR